MYVALTGAGYGVAWESAGWHDAPPRRWFSFDFDTEAQRALFLRWAQKRAGAGPEDRADFLRQWDLASQLDASETRAILAIKWARGDSAAVKALRQLIDGARDTLATYYALNALCD
jgi:hypothetical protein